MQAPYGMLRQNRSFRIVSTYLNYRTTPGIWKSLVVEVVAGRNGGASHQQQNLLERIHHPPGLAVIPELGEMLQQQGQSRPRGLLVEDHDGDRVHDRAPCRIRAPRES